MNLTTISDITQVSKYGNKSVDVVKGNRNGAFESMLQAAKDMVNQTVQYTETAEKAEMAYAMGLTDNTHELQVAQQKANLALQYTVAVRNQVLDAYKEIMNMQF